MGDVNSNAPEPFVFAASQTWDGNDGRWSTFIVRIGTPEQNFRVLPATSGHETLIPVPEGCTDSDPSDCGSLRGAYPFNGQDSSGFLVNASSTWNNIGLYTLNLEDDLGMNDNGLYGFDTVGLTLQNSGGLTLEKQVVAGIATKNFYLGNFGLGPKPSNFSDFEYPQPSFMRSLKDQNKIPSLSFAYTAGAAYRIPKLTGSLTLGGYDAARFTANAQSFPFSDDDSKVLSVGLQGITALNTLSGSRSFLNTPILTLIDSTVSHIWLPRDACDDFEAAFGLTYDSGTDLYTINDTMHERLQDLKPTISFSLGNDADPSKLVTIQLPYSAFDLQASHPFYDNETNYFPIRRAANDTQYTLGRTFLQEAYVIADYERSNFSVHQALFKSPMPEQDIITITTPSNNTSNGTTSTSSSSSGGGLPTGAIAGIAVGVSILAIVLAFIAFIFFRRHRRTKQQQQQDSPAQMTPVEMPVADKYELYQAPNEVHGSKGGFEMDGKQQLNLMSDDAANRQHELPGMDAKYEMPGDGEKRALRHEMGDATSNPQIQVLSPTTIQSSSTTPALSPYIGSTFHDGTATSSGTHSRAESPFHAQTRGEVSLGQQSEVISPYSEQDGYNNSQFGWHNVHGR